MKYLLAGLVIGMGLTIGGVAYAAFAPISVPAGGTGQTTFTSSQLLYGNGGAALSSVATSSETCSSPLSCTAHTVLTGGGAITLSTAGTWSGLAGTATALAANGSNCSAGSYPLGVDASGASETCTSATITVNGTSFASGDSKTINAASSTVLSNANTFSGNNTFSNTITGSITGNAGTATALAANGTNCSAGNYPLGVDASGNAESCTAAGTGGASFPFTPLSWGNSTSTTIGFTNGIISNASSTFSTAPTFSSLSGVLKGNGNNALTVAANGTDYTLITALTCGGTDKFSGVTAAGVFTCSADSVSAGGAGSGTVATSTALVSGQVDFSTSANQIGNSSAFLWDNANKVFTVIGNASTTQLSASVVYATSSINTPAISNLTGNGFVKTSGGNGTLSVDTTTYVSGVTGSYPIVSSGGATPNITFSGLGTTSPWTTSNLAYVVNGNTVSSVATGTVSAGSSAITVTGGRSVIGGALAIDCATATGSQNGCLSSTDYARFNGFAPFAWTPNAGYNATSTTLQFGSGFISSASSTLVATTTFTTALLMGTTRDSALSITAGRTYPASVTTGGMVHLDNSTLNGGPALEVVSGFGSGATGRGIVFNETNTAFDQDFILASSSASNTSALNVKGQPTGKGVIKCEYTGGAGNTNASCISIDMLNGIDSQGLFIKGAVAGTATTKLLNIVDSSSGALFNFTTGGNAGFGTSTPGSLVSVSSNINFTNATSTFQNGGIDLIAGCFSIRGVCISGSGGSGVTSIATNNGITGGTITTTGTIGLATINAGVLGAQTNSTVPTSQATSTLYGNGTAGQVLGWTNGALGFMATSSNFSVLTAVNATTTGTLTIPVSASLVTPMAGNIGIDSTTGQLRYSDVTGTTRVLSPVRDLGFAYATSTWGANATTTIRIGPAPANITVSAAYCETNAGTVGVSFTDAVPNRLDYIRTASTTINKFTFVTNTTFTAGESMRVDVGTPASSPTSISCRLLYTYDAD